MLKLSILIPFYNAGAHLQRCLESVMHQDIDKTEYEVLLIDDGSTDDGAKIVAGFQESYKNIQFFQYENEGAYTQRNKLLDLAKGEYLYFMDADDYIAFDSLGTILNEALAHEAEMAAFDFKVVDLVNFKTDYYRANVFDNAKYGISEMSGPQLIVDKPDLRYEIWWYIIRKDFIERLNLRFEEKRVGGDVLFTTTLLLKAKIMLYCDATIYRYYQSENSIQRNKNKDNLHKLAQDTTVHLINFTPLLKDVKEELGEASPVYERLRQKRDIDVFYLFQRLVKSNYPKAEILKIFDTLKKNNILPIKRIEDKNFRRPPQRVLNFSLKYRFLFTNFLTLANMLYHRRE